MAWNPNIPTVTNRVQDDLNAISQNFQHLDPLAPYVQALLDSRIVEMGTNSNGTYVRWENGLQVCFHTGPTFSVDASTYELYQWSQFPASFDEIWVVLGSSATTGGAAASRHTRSTLGELGGVYRLWMVNDSTEARQMTPHFLAIGRWK